MKKKTLLMCAATMLALGSCSNDEVISTSSQADNNAITYSVMTNNATRSQTLYGATSIANGKFTDPFNVWACLNDATKNYPTYFESQEVEWDSTTSDFKTESTHYWPSESYSLNFVAVNQVESDLTFANGVLSQEVKMQALAEEQVDILYAISIGKTKSSASGAVPLNFRHALAELVFYVENRNPNIFVRLDEVRLCNIYTKNTVTFSAKTSSTDGQYTTSGTNAYSSQCVWSTSSDKKGYAQESSVDIKYLSMKEPNPEEVPYYEGTSTTPYYTGNDDHNLHSQIEHRDVQNDAFDLTASFVIPQSYTVTDKTKIGSTSTIGSAGNYFLLKCTIQNVSNSSTPGFATANDIYLHGQAETATGVTPHDYGTRYILVPITENGSWEAGKKYVYTFTFKDGGDAGYSGGTDPDGPYDPDVPTLCAISYTKDSITIDDVATGANKNVDVDSGITTN